MESSHTHNVTYVIQPVLAKKRSRISQSCPRYFKSCDRLEFSTIRVAQGDPVLTHRATLLEEVWRENSPRRDARLNSS